MKIRPLHWLKEISKYLLFAIVITTAIDLYRAQDVPTEMAPDLVTVDEKGNPVDVIEMSYQTPVVIYFWATWCPVCKFVSPTVDWVSNYYPVVAVS
jgi:thioredoxin-like negative regulator of GroEL